MMYIVVYGPKPALLDSWRPRTGLLSSGIVYTIEGTDTNGILMQNLDEYLITNRLHVRIYSVSRFSRMLFTSVRHIIIEYKAPKVNRDRQCLLSLCIYSSVFQDR